jgi:hypothetical protein
VASFLHNGRARILALMALTGALLVTGVVVRGIAREAAAGARGSTGGPKALSEPMQFVQRGGGFAHARARRSAGPELRKSWDACSRLPYDLTDCPALLTWIDGPAGQKIERLLADLRRGDHDAALAALALTVQIARTSRWQPGIFDGHEDAERLGSMLQDWLRAWGPRSADDPQLLEPALAGLLLYGRVMRTAYNEPAIGRADAPYQRARTFLDELTGAREPQPTPLGARLAARHPRAVVVAARPRRFPGRRGRGSTESVPRDRRRVRRMSAQGLSQDPRHPEPAEFHLALACLVVALGGVLLGLQVDGNGALVGTGLAPFGIGAVVALSATLFQAVRAHAVAARRDRRFLGAVRVPGHRVHRGRSARAGRRLDVLRGADRGGVARAAPRRARGRLARSAREHRGRARRDAALQAVDHVAGERAPLAGGEPADPDPRVDPAAGARADPARFAGRIHAAGAGLSAGRAALRQHADVLGGGFALTAAGLLWRSRAAVEHENDRIHATIHELPSGLAALVEKLLPEEHWVELGLHGLSERMRRKRIEALVGERLRWRRELENAFGNLDVLALANPGGFTGEVVRTLQLEAPDQARKSP